MAKPQGPCSKCKGEMTVTILDTFSGEEGGLKVTVQAMPAVVCGQGHKRFLYPLLAGQLMDMVVDPDSYKSIPTAVKKGLFTKHFHCPGCSKELPATTTGLLTKEMTAEPKHADPFKLQVDVPVFKCEGCGKECIKSGEETGKLGMKAIGHGYREIDIHPT